MAKILYEFLNPHWRGVPYRNQMDIDKIWFGTSGVNQGNGSCASHGVGSFTYAVFGERADVPWILSWGSLKYGIIPCQQLEFAIEFAMESGLLLESEAPAPSVDMSRSQGTYGPIAAKHKFDLHIDFNHTSYYFDPDELKAKLREGYILVASAGSALWGRFHSDGMTLRWLTDEGLGSSHIVCIGGYQERDDGDYFIVQNSQPKITTHPQGFVYAPITRDGWFRFHALGRSDRLLTGNGGGNDTVARQTIKRGSRGEDVVYLQQQLNQFGYNAGSADGIFGTGTENALKVFQRAQKLTADGVCGPKTWAAIEALKNSTDDTPVDLSNDTWMASQKHVKLSKNWTVGDLWLNSKMSTLKIDPRLVQVLDAFADHFGKLPKFVTENSIYCSSGHSSGSKHYLGQAADFYIDGVTPFELAQFAETLPFVGGIGVYSGWDTPGKHIHADVRLWSTQRVCWWVKTSDSNTPGFGGCPAVFKNGHRSPAIIMIQRRLNTLGYNCGSADGIFGVKTETQLKAWQKANGLSSDGAFGVNTNKIMKIFGWG